MVRRPYLCLAFLLGLGSVPALADCGGASGPAAKEVQRLMKATGGDPLDICIFYGDYTGDGKDDALAFLFFGDRDGGNMIMREVHTLRFAKGRFAPDKQDEAVYGQEPRNVTFEKGRIRVTTTVQGPNDPRCCPTLEKRWTIRAGR